MNLDDQQWTVVRNDVVARGRFKGLRVIEYHHSYYGTVIVWPETKTASFWVSSEANHDWNINPEKKLRSDQPPGPGSIVYCDLDGLFSAIKDACVPPVESSPA